MTDSPRQRFLSYVRDHRSARQVVSPFLPHPEVITGCLASLHLPSTGDAVADEITLARELDYEPMFMTDCSGLIFRWEIDPERSGPAGVVKTIRTQKGEWIFQSSQQDVPWHDAAGCPVQTLGDHQLLVSVCEEVGEHTDLIRDYFRTWRRRVGEDGVLVIGHPHPSWLGYQIAPSSIFYHWNDHQALYRRSMEAVAEASLFVMAIAMEEGIDFMSDSSYGLEMTSPELFRTMDLPFIRRFSVWTHEHGGLFWYHNCGFTSTLIRDGSFNMLGADLIETLAPPPEGDNDLAASRRRLARQICSKGNMNLRLLRDGTPEQIREETNRIIAAVDTYPHVISTADGVLQGTRPENYIALVRSARELAKQ